VRNQQMANSAQFGARGKNHHFVAIAVQLTRLASPRC
jgi:hypothetical protein